MAISLCTQYPKQLFLILRQINGEKYSQEIKLASLFSIVYHISFAQSMQCIQLFCYFTFGFLVGFVLFNLLILELNIALEELPEIIESYEPIETRKFKNLHEQRILCVLTTSRKNHLTKAIHVQETWGKHCDKLVFVSTKTDSNLGAIGFDLEDDHNHLWGKVKLIFHYVHKNFIDDFDWIYKGDDDSFAIMENMKYMLSAYSSDDPLYFGHRFKTKEHKYGYFSGGSGYVMSNQALRLFVEKILTNTSLCRVDSDTGSEDWNTGACMEDAGVYPGDTRDALKRDRFLPFDPKHHLFPFRDPTFWYWSYNYYQSNEGLDCCSNYTISTHYIPPQNMYTLYFLNYRQQLYGIQRKFPPIEQERYFSDVVEIDENERQLAIDAIKTN